MHAKVFTPLMSWMLNMANVLKHDLKDGAVSGVIDPGHDSEVKRHQMCVSLGISA